MYLPQIAKKTYIGDNFAVGNLVQGRSPAIQNLVGRVQERVGACSRRRIRFVRHNGHLSDHPPGQLWPLRATVHDEDELAPGDSDESSDDDSSLNSHNEDDNPEVIFGQSDEQEEQKDESIER